MPKLLTNGLDVEVQVPRWRRDSWNCEIWLTRAAASVRSRVYERTKRTAVTHGEDHWWFSDRFLSLFSVSPQFDAELWSVAITTKYPLANANNNKPAFSPAPYDPASALITAITLDNVSDSGWVFAAKLDLQTHIPIMISRVFHGPWVNDKE